MGSGAAGFADGVGAAAQLSEPAGLALGPNGTVFIAGASGEGCRGLHGGPRSASRQLVRRRAALHAVPLPWHSARADAVPVAPPASARADTNNNAIRVLDPKTKR